MGEKPGAQDEERHDASMSAIQNMKREVPAPRDAGLGSESERAVGDVNADGPPDDRKATGGPGKGDPAETANLNPSKSN